MSLVSVPIFLPGTNTWDRWEMRIHKRLIDLHSPSDAAGLVSHYREENTAYQYRHQKFSKK
eukprot:2512260-Amphidinium_carterae.1